VSNALADADIRDLQLPDGRTLRTYVTGATAGELIVMHHGTPASGCPSRWMAEDAASRGALLVGYDRPGYGGSTRQSDRTVADAAKDAAAVADAHRADRFRTWGVSGGGPHALACAALLPERVIAAASLASVAPYDADGLDFLAGMGADNVEEFGAAAEGEEPLRPMLATMREGLLATTPVSVADQMRSLLPPVDVAVITGDFAVYLHESMTTGLQPGYEGWLDDDLAFVSDWGYRVADIKVPTLLHQGRQDLMVPFAHGQWLAARVPGAEVRLTDDDGHLTLIADLGPVHDWLLQQR
jgi:pimeloyl-ACP methyl ester carboxylesterase